MSISKAKKSRMKLEKQGKLSPDALRGGWGGVHPVTKQLPTLKEKQERMNRKHRRNRANEGDGSFYFAAV